MAIIVCRAKTARFRVEFALRDTPGRLKSGATRPVRPFALTAANCRHVQHLRPPRNTDTHEEVPGRGLEPLRIAPPDPKSGASANFATPARSSRTAQNRSRTIAAAALVGQRVFRGRG